MILTRRAWLLGGLAALSIGAMLGMLVQPLFGAPLPMVHITWRDDAPAVREPLERLFRLNEPQPLPDGDWAYVPGDTSTEMVRAMATHRDVEYIDGIDRGRFEIARGARLTARRGGMFAGSPRILARLLKLAAYIFTLLGVVACACAFVPPARIVGQSARVVNTIRTDPRGAIVSAARAGGLWLQRGVPVASAQAAGLFRVVFGTVVLAYVLSNPVDAENLTAYELGGATGLYGAAVRWLADYPGVVESLAPLLAGFGALFIAGIWTKFSYAAFVAAFLAWGSVSALQTTHHAVSALQLTMLALVAAPWGDGWSVDAWLARRRGGLAPDAGRNYGFALWIPLLVLGVTFAAAAWSKVRGGPAWVLNGTVKYHFVTDLDQALVTWGPQLTQHAAMAVALSAGAVIIEASPIFAAFGRSATVRSIAAAGAVALLLGFQLFQGIVWPAWWILLLGFLPWERAPRGAAPASRSGSLTAVQAGVVVAVLVQQIYCSVFEVEARPLLSAYDMYSTTYGSPEEYEAQSNLVYRVVAVAGQERTELPDCEIDDHAARLFEVAAGGGVEERERVAALLAPCLSSFPGVQVLQLEGDRRIYDWEQERFEWKRGIDIIGPVRVDWLKR